MTGRRWSRGGGGNASTLSAGAGCRLDVADGYHQAVAVVAEVQRLRHLDPGLPWDHCAVLAREWTVLNPIRARCEADAIPVCLAVPRDQQPPPFRVREHRRLLDHLRALDGDLCTAHRLLAWLEEQSRTPGDNPWWRNLRQILLGWHEATGDTPQAARFIEEHVCDCLAEQRHTPLLGEGVFLSTIHSAKGIEFDHVFLPDGGWGRTRSGGQAEEERRLYYVAVTRARETLCLFRCNSSGNRYPEDMGGEYLLQRPAVAAQGDGTRMTLSERPGLLRREYALLGPKDIDLGYAGRQSPRASIHAALSRCTAGDRLAAQQRDGHILLTHQGHPIARLSRNACDPWSRRPSGIREIRVLAMVRRTRRDGGEEYRRGYQTDEREVPLAEVVVDP